jgi:hypothetical protein
MKHLRQGLLFAVFLAGLTGRLFSEDGPVVGAESAPTDLTSFLKAFDGYAGAVAQAERVVVFEGLPHPRWEQPAVDVAGKAKPTVRLHGELFYDEAQAVPATEMPSLQTLVSRAMGPFGGEKLCGGFHADYLIRWSKGIDTCDVLLCFGCWEYKIFAPYHATRGDLRAKMRPALAEFVARFRGARPPSQATPASETNLRPPAPPPAPGRSSPGS